MGQRTQASAKTEPVAGKTRVLTRLAVGAASSGRGGGGAPHGRVEHASQPPPLAQVQPAESGRSDQEATPRGRSSKRCDPAAFFCLLTGAGAHPWQERRIVWRSSGGSASSQGASGRGRGVILRSSGHTSATGRGARRRGGGDSDRTEVETRQRLSKLASARTLGSPSALATPPRARASGPATVITEGREQVIRHPGGDRLVEVGPPRRCLLQRPHAPHLPQDNTCLQSAVAVSGVWQHG